MDTSKKSNRFKNLNKYSWLLILIFIFAVLAMSYKTANISLDGLMQTIPLIVVFVFWCEKSAQRLKRTENNLKKAQLFHRDTFILSFSFLLGCLISLLFAYDNSDAKGWWVFIIYFISLYGLIFSLIFSGIALLIKNHNAYILVYSFLIIGFVSLGQFFPHDTFIPLLGYTDTFYAITGTILIIHCLFTLYYKVISVLQRKNI
ncbi:hypothetical protein [Legionella worsleiensis]|uniref:Transmembrane protein n=1 Tax=Legionella worsleiensis TaxID=45076 RepID=A0A0W1AE88_9GAMM|nr:hypothetical protein [Legionella worsleiensis]KTD79647.1 hypothetical protein Lwor_1161 [Legionella worsleiensis]STY32157.1 Uncharacterised protein [Legionella worsleiensis]